jgi:hypothetical protein
LAWTSASPSPGSGIATSSIRNTDGGPKSTKRNDFIALVFMALESLEEIASALFHDLWA